MNVNEQKPVKKTETEQVLSVKISKRNIVGLFSEGINLLKDFGFSEIGKIAQDKQSNNTKNRQSNQQNSDGRGHTEGKAPNDGANMFVILEYPFPPTPYMTCILYLIDRETKKTIDNNLICRFLPDCNGEQKNYSVANSEGMEWEIVTVPAPQKLLDKIALFVGDKTRISVDDNLGMIECLPEGKKINFMTSKPGIIEKLTGSNSNFAVFVNKNCSEDTSITNVSDAINSQIEKDGGNIRKFAVNMVKAEQVQIIYNLVKLKKLHPELRPLLNMTKSEAAIQNKHVLGIEVAAVLSRFDLERQLSVWESLDKNESKGHVLWQVRKILREHKISPE